MKKKLIFIAYYFYPYKAVGANRIRFWATYLDKYYEDIVPVVVTATEFTDSEKIVPDQYFVRPEKNKLKTLFIKDEGINWTNALKRFFLNTRFNDVMGVVITGGPFMQFSIVPTLQKILKCKIAIDFRDPFSNNERFRSSVIKIAVKRLFEKQFVKNADYVICVNEVYFDSLAGYDKGLRKFHVIPNGYDEDSIDRAREERMSDPEKRDGIILILTGKYYARARPDETFKALGELNQDGINLTFEHYGDAEFTPHEPGHSFVREHGITDYREIAKALVRADIGLIITSQNNQTTQTKVFDYMGSELPILIITDGPLNGGILQQITADYPLVKWCRNECGEIKSALKSLMDGELKINFPNRINFSRKEGLKSLIRIFST